MNSQKWLTAKEASQYCYESGLPRSVKSLRRWCANGEVDAQKRHVANKHKWFIDRTSLDIKIKEELEFLKHSEKPLSQPPIPHAEPSTEPTPITTAHKRSQPDMSGHDRTQADISGYERTQADTSGHERSQPGNTDQPQIRDLEDQILLLENDIKWRSQLLKDQKNTNATLMDEIKGQSRYIGHLETNVLRLGGNTDPAFLKAPVPKSERSYTANEAAQIVTPEIIVNDRPHPD